MNVMDGWTDSLKAYAAVHYVVRPKNQTTLQLRDCQQYSLFKRQGEKTVAVSRVRAVNW